MRSAGRTMVSCSSAPVVRTGGFPSPNSSARDGEAEASSAGAAPLAVGPRARGPGFWFLSSASAAPAGSLPITGGVVSPLSPVPLKKRKLTGGGFSPDRRTIQKAVSELFVDCKPLKARHIRMVKSDYGTEIRAVRPCTPTGEGDIDD